MRVRTGLATVKTGAVPPAGGGAGRGEMTGASM
jgi:hypothetical protein